MPDPSPAYYAHSPGDAQNGDWSLAHGLLDHLTSVAQLAASFGKGFGAESFCHAAGLWHDLGKYRAGFQAYIRGQPHGPKSHKWAGAVYAQKIRGYGEIIASAIAGHHGGLHNRSDFTSRLGEASAELTDSLAAAVPKDLLDLPKLASPPALLSALKSRPDLRESIQELFIRLVFSALVDADYLDTSFYYNPLQRQVRSRAAAAQSSPAELADRLNRHVARLTAGAPATEVNRVRANVWDHCLQAASHAPGRFSLTVPTGGGKTLAAMGFALEHAHRHGLARVIVVLPFTAIIEQSAAIYGKIFGAVNVVEHHSAWRSCLARTR